MCSSKARLCLEQPFRRGILERIGQQLNSFNEQTKAMDMYQSGTGHLAA
jgi:hypothetical protein